MPRVGRPVGEAISLDAGRRIALNAQGFGDSRPSGRVDVRHLRRVVDRVGALQLDSVNVLCRSHYLPMFARLGPYPRTTLDRMCWGDGGGRELFEYFWGHKASMLPLSYYPLQRWRMRAAEAQAWDAPLHPDVTAPWSVVAGMRRLSTSRPGFVGDVLARVTERGPITAGDASPDGVRRKRTDEDPDPTTGRMWNWQDAKIAIEYLFCTGRVAIAGRRNFERLYDLSERVLPSSVLRGPESSADKARRELVRISGRTLGVATARELCGATGGHFPLPTPTSTRVINELVDAGELLPVRVEGESRQAYLSSDADDRPVDARALLSPFDTLIWNRDRTQRLFDFFYRIGIYTPAAQRQGYYVLPFLLGDRLVGRVDLKSDRRGGALVVPVVSAEPGISEHDVVEPLAAELVSIAQWLHLDQVVVTADDALGRALTAAIEH
jgi:uncharacterized protein